MSLEFNDSSNTFFQDQPNLFQKKIDDDCNRTLSNQSELEDNNLILNNFSLLTKADEPDLQALNRNIVYEKLQEKNISRTHEEEMKLDFPKPIFLVEKYFKSAINEIQLSKNFSEKINQELFSGRKIKESMELFTLKKEVDSISKYIYYKFSLI